MLNSSVLGVVPARLGSQRLPGKPLLDLAGRPLIEWVWRRVSGFAVLDDAVIATDSREVLDASTRFGGRAVMTAQDHASGTERVAEVARRPEYADFGIIVNVQGDEPLIESSHVEAAVEQVRAGWDVGTVATPVRTLAAFHDPSVVKMTRRPDGAALYFSRSAIPHRRGGEPDGDALGTQDYLRHVGVYAFTRTALERWVALPADRLEVIEKLEQLRPLRAGLTIGVGIVEHAEGGVDTTSDAERVAVRLREIERAERSR